MDYDQEEVAMQATELKGICPIIATPFTEKGAVDYDSFANLVRTLIQGGCHAVTLFGIAGEYYKLTDEEMIRLARLTVDICRQYGGTSILSVTQHATPVAVARARLYEEMGASALMLLPPFFLKPGQAALYQHMKAVGQAVRIPVMAQYAPEQTGVAIPPTVYAQLFAECPNIAYYKIECKPAGAYITSLIGLTQRRAGVFVGNAGYQFIEGFDRGAIGAMPGCSMFDLYLRLYDAYVSGDRAGAAHIHSTLILPMLNHIRQNVEMIIAFEKKILKKRGIIQSDFCREPGFVSDAYYDRLFEEHYDAIRAHFSAR